MSHWNEYMTIVAGIAVVKNKEGKYLFLRRSDQEAYAAGKWDFPGGAKEFLESTEDGAVRECFEETGIEPKVERLLWHRVSRGKMDHQSEFVSFFYLCTTEMNQVALSAEHDDYKWLTLDEAKDLECIPWMEDFFEKVHNKQIEL